MFVVWSLKGPEIGEREELVVMRSPGYDSGVVELILVFAGGELCGG